eukprot:876964-Pleurochrysis_carterae.AAC.1
MCGWNGGRPRIVCRHQCCQRLERRQSNPHHVADQRDYLDVVKNDLVATDSSMTDELWARAGVGAIIRCVGTGRDMGEKVPQRPGTDACGM